MKKIIGITVIVILALWGLVIMSNQAHQREEEPLPRNDVQNAVAYTDGTELQEGSYAIDSNTSYLEWKGRSVATAHYGTVYPSKGEITIIDDRVSGDIVLDMNTIASEIGLGLDDHLKNKDFFDVTKYPEARITITDYINNEVQGDLTIKDITQPVSLPVILNQDDNIITMNGTFSLDRTLWGIEYNSSSILSDLGDRAISDLIEFEVVFMFEKING